MNLDFVRTCCMSLPNVTEGVQWGNDLLFRVGGRMFAVACLEPGADNRLAFKCTPEEFAELTEIEGIIPAPYMARNHWVSIQQWGVMSPDEYRDRLKKSYDLVFANLPKKLQRELASTPPAAAPARRAAPASKSAKSGKPASRKPAARRKAAKPSARQRASSKPARRRSRRA